MLDNAPKSSSVRPRHAMNPSQLAYRMPGEWEHHAATWMIWPHVHPDWPGRRRKVEATLAPVAAALSQTERVHFIVRDSEMERHARQVLSRHRPADVHFHHFHTNRAWLREHGAVFLRREAHDRQFPERIAIDWGFRGHTEEPPSVQNNVQDRIAHRMAQAVNVPCVTGGISISGSALDSNGAGTVLANEAGILRDDLNPGITRQEATRRINNMLGSTRVFWINTAVEGDRTNGNVDMLARFVSTNRIAVVFEESRSDTNYAICQKAREQLEEAIEHSQEAIELVHLPGPANLRRRNRRLPASYANFYIANRMVLVPQFASHRDQAAIDTLTMLFPNRRIIGVDCTAMISPTASLHSMAVAMP